MKNLMHIFGRGSKLLAGEQKGFTLIELLVVIAILGVLAAVAVPYIANFIGTANDEALEVELHDVQAAVIAVMADAKTGTITAVAAENDMDNIGIDIDGDGTNDLVISDYMVGLNDDGTVKTGATYDVSANGIVTQN